MQLDLWLHLRVDFAIRCGIAADQHIMLGMQLVHPLLVLSQLQGDSVDVVSHHLQLCLQTLLVHLQHTHLLDLLFLMLDSMVMHPWLPRKDMRHLALMHRGAGFLEASMCTYL